MGVLIASWLAKRSAVSCGKGHPLNPCSVLFLPPFFRETVTPFNHASVPCPLCGQPIGDQEQVFSTWGAFPVRLELARFCDAEMHWSCYRIWPHQAEFAKAYFDFWVDEECTNRCWAKAFHDDHVFMTVNPFIADQGEAILVLSTTGSRLRVEIEDWLEWLEAPEMSDEEPMHPAEIAEMRRLVPRLRAAFPTVDDIMNALDGESKGWTIQD